MEQCGLSTAGTESGVTESTGSGVTKSRESSSPSPVSGVSGWCSWEPHSGYTLTHTLDTSVAPNSTQSMSILRTNLSEKLNRLLLIRSEMACAKVDSDIVYANHSGQDSSEVTHSSNFEDRFAFHRSNELPPPLPLKSPTLTLPKKPNIVITTPGSPGVAGSPRTGSPRSPGQSPRIERKYKWDNHSRDTSFETATSKGSQYIEGTYKERLLLHDTLRSLQVQETTKRESSLVINKFIATTFILLIIMVLSVSILGTILIMQTYNVCDCPTTQAHNRIPNIPDSLHRKDSPSMTHHSDETHETHADKEPSALQTGRIGLAPVVDKDYKITIQVTNNTVESGTDDFWNS